MFVEPTMSKSQRPLSYSLDHAMEITIGKIRDPGVYEETAMRKITGAKYHSTPVSSKVNPLTQSWSRQNHVLSNVSEIGTKTRTKAYMLIELEKCSSQVLGRFACHLHWEMETRKRKRRNECVGKVLCRSTTCAAPCTNFPTFICCRKVLMGGLGGTRNRSLSLRD